MMTKGGDGSENCSLGVQSNEQADRMNSTRILMTTLLLVCLFVKVMLMMMMMMNVRASVVGWVQTKEEEQLAQTK